MQAFRETANGVLSNGQELLTTVQKTSKVVLSNDLLRREVGNHTYVLYAVLVLLLFNALLMLTGYRIELKK